MAGHLLPKRGAGVHDLITFHGLIYSFCMLPSHRQLCVNHSYPRDSLPSYLVGHQDSPVVYLEVKEPSLSGWYPALPSAGPGPCRCVDILIGLLSDDQQLVPGEIRTE